MVQESKIWTKKSKMKKIPFFKGLNKVKFGLKKQNEKYLYFRGLEKAKFAIIEIK